MVLEFMKIMEGADILIDVFFVNFIWDSDLHADVALVYDNTLELYN